MKAILTIFLTLIALPAAADPGHFADLAGHDHWLAAGALGGAALIALWAGLKGKKDEAEVEDDVEDSDEELQEA